MSWPVTLITSESDFLTFGAVAAPFATLVMDPTRDYAYCATQDSWICQGPFLQEATKASLDLDTVTANVTTVVQAKVAGTSGNSITLESVADGTGVGTLDESGFPAIVFHFEDGVTTVTNFENAVTASVNLEVLNGGVGANFWADPGDVFGPTNLSGAVNESLVTPVASAGAGSTFVPAKVIVYLDGARGDSLSVIRNSVDGDASLTAIARDKIGVPVG